MYLFAITMMTFSIPVMPGRTKRINIGNNKVITAELCGDESFKYWQSADGEQYEYMPKNGIYAKLSNKLLTRSINIAMQKRTMRMLNSIKATRGSTGNKKALVILVNFQDTHFLENSTPQLYESILNQTYKDFELIIINDGSADNSLEIIEKYKQLDKRIVVISRENKGLIKSLNEAIEQSKGSYIARMDADDISLPTRFEEQLKFMKDEKLDMCGSWVEPFENDKLFDK